MKYPCVYVYKRTSDKGQELKYSIRSLENVKNWNGEVFVAGDNEDWFKDVKVIEAKKSHVKWTDQENKLRAIVGDKRVADDFIYFNDDMYCVTPTEITPLYDGKLENYTGKNGWQKAKSDTKDYLEKKGATIFNYDIHVPMVFNKDKLAKILDILDENRKQPRSLYGNLYEIGGEQYKDRKTYTSKLRKGKLLSTKRFTPELKELFKSKSRYEL